MSELTRTNQSGAELFNEFFQRLKTHYPSWRQQLKSQEEHDMLKQELVKTLTDNGIDSWDKLKIGLNAAAKDESSWLPCAGQFLGMCKPTPESLGLPNVKEAYKEAVFHRPEDEWSCSLVYFARLSIQNELKTLPEVKSFKIFERMYKVVLERILNGEQLSAPPKPLPAPDQVSKKLSPKKVSAIIAEIADQNGWKL